MKFVKFILSLLLTAGLVFALNKKWGDIPPLGKLVSPQYGFWKNSESSADYTNKDFKFKQLKGKVSVYMDKRLVPHVFAENDEDAFFIQGYLHAKYRLWQMEFQTYFAAGRISEIVGEVALPSDRKFRRLGMVYAAEKSVEETQKDPITKAATDNYTAGVNAYISSLKEADYPVEYKLLDYKPEPWTNLKTALLLKYMSYDLSGPENDFEKQNTKSILTKAMYEIAYQYGNDSLDPILPNTTVFNKPGINLIVPKNVDSVYFNFLNSTASTIKDVSKPDKDNGSNNWAVAGSKTQSGSPILSNDPHLGIKLPSLWYEMQLNTPNFNTYGATLPGSPAVIIGFNDSCSFGFTNAMRDVRDYYEIKFKDESRKEYMFNGKWQTAMPPRYEVIKLRGKADFIDTVVYIKEFGPVMYDASFRGAGVQNATATRTDGKNYAVKWIAHTPSNELSTFLQLDKSKNFADYEKAISTFICPGQNMIFACHSGDIAIKQQGVFPAKWYRQGDFPMPGWDSTYIWQGMIPQNENYMMRNPERGFVSSANQYPYNTKNYPYYLGGNYPFSRGYTINKLLTPMKGITVEAMQQLQNNNTNAHGKMFTPFLLKHIKQDALKGNASKYLTILNNWNYEADIASQGQTIFTLWADNFEDAVWQDELSKIQNTVRPVESTVFDATLKDSNMVFVDNINTPQKETLRDIVTTAFNSIIPTLDSLESNGKLAWGMYKATRLNHLMDTKSKLPFSRFNLPIGGGEHIINATKKDHGPSWKMIVEMKATVEAYGIYPGGQSGNPGSKYYDNAVMDWASGKYYKLWLMKATEKNSADVLFTMNFSN